MLCGTNPNERLVMSSAVTSYSKAVQCSRRPVLVVTLVVLLVSALTPGPSQAEDNPALPGFRADASDARAIEIADEVMARLMA